LLLVASPATCDFDLTSWLQIFSQVGRICARGAVMI